MNRQNIVQELRADSDVLTHKQVYRQRTEIVNELTSRLHWPSLWGWAASVRLLTGPGKSQRTPPSQWTPTDASDLCGVVPTHLTETYKYSTCRLTEWSVCVVVETGGGVMLFTGETLTLENHVSVKTNSFYFLYNFQLFIWFFYNLFIFLFFKVCNCFLWNF